MRTPPPLPEMTCGFLIQLVFCKKNLWIIGVEVEQETSAPPPKKYPGSAPVMNACGLFHEKHFSMVFLLQHESRILTTALSAVA